METKQLQDKVIVITGSSRGFGKACAAACLDAGAKVVVTSRSAERARQTAAELDPDSQRAVGTGCDVSDPAQVKALMAFALTTFGKVDVWVNNAGIAGAYGAVHEITPESFTNVLDTNILGTYYGSWAAINTFLDQGYGKLINILGRGDKQPTPYQVAYASSKAWMLNFTTALAKEIEDSNIGVFSFNPGLMTTDLLSDLTVVAGNEDKLSVFSTIISMWGQPPSTPAEKLVWIAGPATDGKTGKTYKELGFGMILAGALREGWRRLVLRKKPEVAIHMESIPPADWQDL